MFHFTPGRTDEPTLQADRDNKKKKRKHGTRNTCAQILIPSCPSSLLVSGEAVGGVNVMRGRLADASPPPPPPRAAGPGLAAATVSPPNLPDPLLFRR